MCQTTKHYRMNTRTGKNAPALQRPGHWAGLFADGEHMSSTQHDLGYWRKFSPLHKYIVDTFADGVDECQKIDLTEDDLETIAQALTDAALPSNDDCGGFFFGDGEMWDEMKAEAARHAEKIRAAAKWINSSPLHPSGSCAQWRSVHYQASW